MNVSVVAFATPGSLKTTGVICIAFSNADYAGNGSGGIDKDGDFIADVSAGQVVPPRAVSIDLAYKGARLFIRDVVCLEGVVNTADINGTVSPAGTYGGEVVWNGSKGVITISCELILPAQSI